MNRRNFIGRALAVVMGWLGLQTMPPVAAAPADKVGVPLFILINGQLMPIGCPDMPIENWRIEEEAEMCPATLNELVAVPAPKVKVPMVEDEVRSPCPK